MSFHAVLWCAHNHGMGEYVFTASIKLCSRVSLHVQQSGSRAHVTLPSARELCAGFGFVELTKRLGIERCVYTAGELKDTLDPFRC